MNVEVTRCVLCLHYFDRFVKPRRRGSRLPGVRKKGSLTCSVRCSGIMSGLGNSKAITEFFSKRKLRLEVKKWKI